MRKPKNKKPVKLRPNKLALWYNHYTNSANPVTFLNKTASAKVAGYKCTTDESFRAVGYQNFTKLHDKIEQWLDDNKFSLAALKNKHAELLKTHKTVFQKVKGHVDDADLAPGVVIVAETHKKEWDKAEVAYDDGETVLAINVADPEIQRRALDMAYKVKGAYAPKKRELTGKDGGPIPLTSFPPEPKSIEEWEKNRKAAEKKRLIPESQSQ